MSVLACVVCMQACACTHTHTHTQRDLVSAKCFIAGPQCKNCKICNPLHPMQDCRVKPYCQDVHDAYCFYDNDQKPQCLCPPEFHNRQISDDIHNAAPHPHCISACKGYCQNNATCVLDNGVPRCTCVGPWTDSTCQLRLCQEECYYPGTG